MKEAFYYCTCIDDKVDKEKKVSNGRTPYRLVPTCKEGICSHCGYYAVASDIVIKNTFLIAHVTREIKPMTDSVEGGLSLASIKRIKNVKLTNKKINSSM